ncbi:survival of motor neuron-related-splicing factor 30 isoform X2 [Erpetoichthys calabaricus]|uniref:survival of motor neuron-related-splicing factor 30 isoform X2 n=1 Tax=Erpetoichthys calabaricus TaxID=27687 RepID=UPI002233F08B|nr:survival of motor neuron-related-splicing factor 30 isoform X2 [Erpetoichthys calabaricus]
MSDDLVKQLASYKAQLHQVEAALSTDADNEDLVKLQKDLQEVIELTKDLLSSQPSVAIPNSRNPAATPVSHSWEVGDSCMAVWSEDGQLYEAEIEEIDEENGTAAITFLGYGNAEVIPLVNLKPAEEGKKSEEDGGKSKSSGTFLNLDLDKASCTLGTESNGARAYPTEMGRNHCKAEISPGRDASVFSGHTGKP